MDGGRDEPASLLSSRKLAAILDADVEGCSRVMGGDEAATVRTRAAYGALIADRVSRHRGRVVDFTRDGKAMGAPTAAKRIFAITVILLATAVSGEAQQQPPIHRIGVLLTTSQKATPPLAEFKTALRDLGYAEGRNLIIEWRWAEGSSERLSPLAADLVRLNVELIVADGNDATAAMMKVTSTIPTVMMASLDPVGAGLIKSLSRPGGNVTGTAAATPEFAGKLLEVLKEAVPKASVVSILVDRSYPRMGVFEAETRAAASRLGITLDIVDVKTPGDVAGALARVERARPSALYVVAFSAVREMLPDIIEFAARQRIPAIYTTSSAVRFGGLMSYSPNLKEIGRRVAWYVDSILKGRKPADLPAEQPTRYDLMINRKTATALGFTVPRSVLARASEIIE
ncbi:MAG: ABC transporter substrate-binding protein [Candidatus Rokubacteria bacterium]|nr:ABC transporter substrate-binding protein [Candidatus Rokubacteria bacterium]